MDTAILLFIFVIAVFWGKELISKVLSPLHMPLMSAANVISGVTVYDRRICGNGSGAWNVSSKGGQKQ